MALSHLDQFCNPQLIPRWCLPAEWKPAETDRLGTEVNVKDLKGKVLHLELPLQE